MHGFLCWPGLFGRPTLRDFDDLCACVCECVFVWEQNICEVARVVQSLFYMHIV